MCQFEYQYLFLSHFFLFLPNLLMFLVDVNFSPDLDEMTKGDEARGTKL